MDRVRVWISMSILLVYGSLAIWAQQSADKFVVPPVVRFSGTLSDENGKPAAGVVGVTFYLYRDSQGGSPLWLETQNVKPDKLGHYSVMLGSSSGQGLPADLFTAGEPRWVGVQPQGQTEQPRVMLVSVPYALKSGDAETLGGLPASAFVLVSPSSAVGSGSTSPAGGAGTPSVLPAGTITGSGTPGFLPDFSGAATIGDSAVFQSGASPTAKIGINTNTPTTNLDVHGGAAVRGLLSLPPTGVATAAAGKNSQPENLAASAFNSGTSTAVAQTFQLKAEPVGNNTSTPSGSLNLLFGQGISAPAETGLKISSKGILTLATGQTFPGAGTVQSVGSGAGLTGGPITNAGPLSIANAGVTNSMLANPALTINAGTDLLGGGLVSLGGSTTLNVDTSKVPQLNTANTFTGNQTVNGNLSATGLVTGSSYNIGSNLFAFGSYTNGNAFLGFSGNVTTTGTSNTAVGRVALLKNVDGYYNTATGAAALYSNTSGHNNIATGNYALDSNTTGYFNSATGAYALENNTTGFSNTANGRVALAYNTTGSNNTGVGYYAGGTADFSYGTGSNGTFVGANAVPSTGTLTNATAIGANAEVAASNSLVLGSINGVNSATADTNVGIGITAPAARLHIGLANSTGLRVEGPNSQGTGAFAASFGGWGDFNIDAVGIVGGRFSVKENGQVMIGTTYPYGILTVGYGLGSPVADGWAVYSSRRWKTNIQTLNGALGKVEQLRGVSYDMRDSGKHQIGVIAEEVGAVVPEVVTWEKNGKDAQSVDYSRLTALLIEATKEQQTLICQQQRQIQAQEAKLKVQQAQIGQLTRQVRAVRVALGSGRRTGSGVQTAKADVSPTLR